MWYFTFDAAILPRYIHGYLLCYYGIWDSTETGGNFIVSLKETYLLASAHSFDLEQINDCYDELRQINITMINGKKQPTVLCETNAPTQSKTAAYPGDDDPDPEDERCY